MWRDVDARDDGARAVGAMAAVEADGASGAVGEASASARDVLSRDLDLPRGTARERVRVRGRDYELSGDDVRDHGDGRGVSSRASERAAGLRPADADAPCTRPRTAARARPR